MSDPEAVPSIVRALSAVMGDVQSVGKTGRNEQQGFNFRGIDAVVNAVGPAFRRHGVVPMPRVLSATYGEFATRSGTVMHTATLEVEFTFHGPDGSSMACSAIGEAADAGDKAVSKAHSVAYRTALLQALCIPTDEPDPDATTFERAAHQAPVRRPWGDVKATMLERLVRGGVADPPNAARAIWAEHTPADRDVTDEELDALTSAVAARIAIEAATEDGPS